ncbi:MAG: Rossmann-like domain-containing protein [Coriobacteriales bacterium]
MTAAAWALYDEMIDGIPEDVLVKDYGLGVAWSYLEAECGMGVAYTARQGGRRTTADDLRGVPLKTVAALSKSWCFEEATLGVAALNAWYSNPERLARYGIEVEYEKRCEGEPEGPRLGKKLDAFQIYRPQIEAKGNAKVVVVGHFPHVVDIAEYAQLTVLERACRDEWDTPDPACEYVMPEADYAFITGVTIINKTAPRLLELCRDAHTIMCGPSVIMAPALFARDVECMAGSIVTDPEATKFASRNGVGQLFGRSLQMVMARK